MAARYWWGQREEERRVRWVPWRKLSNTKGEGDMGFKDMASFNIILLAKMAWRLLQNPN